LIPFQISLKEIFIITRNPYLNRKTKNHSTGILLI
jgi:hypothetical protein